MRQPSRLAICLSSPYVAKTTGLVDMSQHASQGQTDQVPNNAHQRPIVDTADKASAGPAVINTGRCFRSVPMRFSNRFLTSASGGRSRFVYYPLDHAAFGPAKAAPAVETNEPQMPAALVDFQPD